MILDNIKNFGKVTVLTGYDATATSIALIPGDYARLPDPVADGPYNLVWWNNTDYADPADDPNREIIRIVAGSADTKTILRGQEGTLATVKNIPNKTYKLINTFTKFTYDKINTEFNTLETEITNINNVINNFGGSFPSQSGHAGQFLTTNGTTLSWSSVSSGGQANIQFKDEGTSLGTSGTVTDIDFTGTGVTASRSGNVLTVNIPGGGSGSSSFTLTGDTGTKTINGGDTLNAVTNSNSSAVFVTEVGGSGTSKTLDHRFNITGNAGKAPRVNSAGTAMEWYTPSDGSAYSKSGITIFQDFSGVSLGLTGGFRMVGGDITFLVDQNADITSENGHPGIVSAGSFSTFDVITGISSKGISNNSFEIETIFRHTLAGGSISYVVPISGNSTQTEAVSFSSGQGSSIVVNGVTLTGITLPSVGSWCTLNIKSNSTGTNLTVKVDGVTATNSTIPVTGTFSSVIDVAKITLANNTSIDTLSIKGTINR